METQTNPDSHLLEAYAELKQRCVDLEKINAHLSFKFNQAKDPEFDAQRKIIRLESELKESKEIIAKLKELRRADGLEMNSLRLTSENLLREVTHLNELRRKNAHEFNLLQEKDEKVIDILKESDKLKSLNDRFVSENKTLLNQWSDNSTWRKRKEDNEVLINLCIETLQSIIEGKTPTNIIVEYGSSESDSK